MKYLEGRPFIFQVEDYCQSLGYSSYTEMDTVLKVDLRDLDSSHDPIHNKHVPPSKPFTP